MIKLFSLKQKQEQEAAAGTSQQKKTSAAQLRVTKGCLRNKKKIAA